MSDITLQLSYDFSFIDLAEHKDTDGKITAIDLKVSLLSTGNSYDHLDGVPKTQLDSYRESLLPFNWLARPTYLRIWRIVSNDIAGYIDLNLDWNLEIDGEDAGKIQAYFDSSLKSQTPNPGDMVFPMEQTNKQVLYIDEAYESKEKPTEGKSRGIIAQMAQKLFPFNQEMQLVYLLSKNVIVQEEIEFFTATDPGKTSFICFPVSENEDSIWYASGSPYKSVTTDYYYLTYRDRNLNETPVLCKAYTVPTPYPHADAAIENVTLRTGGKFDGSVKIEVEQDNDWKVSFADGLTNLLDIRAFIFDDLLGKENGNALHQQLIKDFPSEPALVKKYILSPFTYLLYLIPGIKNLYLNTKITNLGSDTTKEQLDALRLHINTDFTSYSTNINKYHTQETEKEELLLAILELIPFNLQDGEALNSVAEVRQVFELFSKLSDVVVQQILIAILFQFDYDSVLADIKVNGKLYAARINEDRIWLTKKETTGIENEIGIEKLDLQPFDIYSAFNSFLMQYAIVDSVPMLKYLTKDITLFDATHIKSTIPGLIDALYNDNASPKAKIKFPETGLEQFDFKLKSIETDRLKKSIEKKIDALTEKPSAPSTEQLPIRIRMGNPNRIAPKNDDEKDDLADELSGYVLLSTRSGAMNVDGNYGQWKYHNWANAKLNTDNRQLSSSFLVPSYLPEQNGVQQIFMEISNESSSLIANLAGLHTVDAAGKEQAHIAHIDYTLPAFSVDNTEEENKAIIQNNPYALRYGYYYDFSAYAVLNSGVLPEPLRKNAVLNKFEEVASHEIIGLKKPFLYLRTKAVSPPNIILKDPKDKATKYPGDYPKALNPLYNELFPADTDAGNNKNPIMLGKNFNNDCSIKVRKPRTEFWDCYSFDWAEFAPEKATPNKYKIARQVENSTEKTIDYLDPAVANSIWIEIEVINNLETNALADPVLKGSILYNEWHEGIINFKWGDTDQLDTRTRTITLSQGKIYKISFFNLIDKKYFEKDALGLPSGACRFDLKRAFIPDRELQDSGGLIKINDGGKEIACYKVSVDHLIFETAYISENQNQEKKNQQLWELFKVEELVNRSASENHNTPSVKLLLDSKSYNGFNRVKVQHQRIDWQGRQPNIDLAALGEKNNLNLGNHNTTTEAMRLDAWWNAERPHDTSIISYSSLWASKTGKENVLHEYKNVVDNHAMLLKYSLKLYNRYEALGEPYNKDFITSQINIEEANRKYYPWKFYLKKSKRTEQLPAPSVRFYIPLTHSIKEAGEAADLNIADVMLILDDVWYREAGLAQKFTLGIVQTKDPDADTFYPEAGYDTTLSLAKTKPLPSAKEDAGYMIVEDKHIKGPLGFTFDFAATNPKINATSFVVSGNGLATYIGEDHLTKGAPFYPMFKLAVRSEVSLKLHEIYADKTLELAEKEVFVAALTSKWSGAQWVQFLKAVDSFVPDLWRNDVRQNGFVDIAKGNIRQKLGLPAFSVLGDVFGDNHNWYLILSSIESNIGGLPVERYYNTFLIDEDKSSNELPTAHNQAELKDFSEGYARIMIVRKSADHRSNTGKDIWHELFGDGSASRIQDDNTLGMPIITERIPLRIL